MIYGLKTCCFDVQSSSTLMCVLCVLPTNHAYYTKYGNQTCHQGNSGKEQSTNAKNTHTDNIILHNDNVPLDAS